MKPWTAALTTGILFCANCALADTVVATADRMLDVLAGHIVVRPQITKTNDGKDFAINRETFVSCQLCCQRRCDESIWLQIPENAGPSERQKWVD